MRFWGGGKRTIECALQNQFWRPQKMDLPGLCRFPLRKTTGRKQTGGGKRIIGGGVQNRFWEGAFFPGISFGTSWVHANGGKIGSSQTWLFQKKRSFALFCAFCALLCSVALFCALLRTCVCALLRSFALFCTHLRTTAFRTTAFGNSRV